MNFLQEKLRKRRFKSKQAGVKEFTAYIIRGNRQVIRREVMASKRFRVDEETYMIKPECIFLRNVGGILKSVSYYREGNPNPYDFKTDNRGITPKELDDKFSEDFFEIITSLQKDIKMKYMLIIVIVNLVMCVLILSQVMMGVSM